MASESIRESGGLDEGSSSSPPVLEFCEIVKTFAGQVAVDHVSFEVRSGEVHGLVGENGAGKSTLVKVLAGEHKADDGQIYLNGERLHTDHPSETTRRGIGFIHQVPALVPSLSVSENVYLGLEFPRNPLGLISWSRVNQSVRPFLERVGLGDVNPGAKLGSLDVAERQLVALARVLTIDHLQAVVFDEVTAPLTEQEVDRLFRIIAELKSAGTGIIYISHRLEEIFELADRVTVMKDGRYVATAPAQDLSHDELTRLIIGKEPDELFGNQPAAGRDAVVMSVRDLSDQLLDDVSFDLHEGEVLGLAGLGGSGRTNVVRAIFGASSASGAIYMHGEQVELRSPADAVAHGIGLVTEDRQDDGFIARDPVWKNVTLPWLGDFSRFGFLDAEQERAVATKAIERFDIRTRSVETPLRELSGGNQQKTILAKWLARPLKVLMLDEPTHGVDVGAKEEIYKIIRNAAAEGLSLVLISSELEELVGLCGRVLLLVEGRIVGELTGDDITEAAMLEALYEARPA